MRPPLKLIAFAAYACITWYSLRQSSLPTKPCEKASHNCIHPIVNAGDTLSLELLLHQPIEEGNRRMRRWTPVETCRLSVTIPPSESLPREITSNDKQNCTVSIPSMSRIRWFDHEDEVNKGGPLLAKFIFRKVDNGTVGLPVAEVPLELTRIVNRENADGWGSPDSASSRRSLLEKSEREMDDSAGGTMDGNFLPTWKYGSQPVLLRFVAEERSYAPPYFRQDGIAIRALSWNRTAYKAILYVDDNGLQHSSHHAMAPPSEESDNRPPILLKIKISTLSPMRDVINQQVTKAIEMSEDYISGGELDEFRYWLRDERLYRFLLTQVISFLHIWIDYLAFRDELQFYRGKSDLGGVSASSVITRLVCSIIILLYLMDGGGTSWVVLLSVFSGVAIEAWKVWRLLRPTFHTKFPFVRYREIQSSLEKQTASYDRVATKYLMFCMYPIVFGWSIYALYYYKYASWYSWFISNMANAVYTFGFIALCPQLYINYRLKSVAHLPWKVFLYKVFNTFVDDVFAFLIEMPWKHRIMTLRDDVVFIMFLFQAYVYRVDKSRTNEFGYSYENEQDNVDGKKELVPPKDKDL